MCLTPKQCGWTKIIAQSQGELMQMTQNMENSANNNINRRVLQRENNINFCRGKIVTHFINSHNLLIFYSEGSRCIILKDLREQVWAVLITFICEIPEAKNETKHPVMLPSVACYCLTTSRMIYFNQTCCLNHYTDFFTAYISHFFPVIATHDRIITKLLLLLIMSMGQ